MFFLYFIAENLVSNIAQVTVYSVMYNYNQAFSWPSNFFFFMYIAI